MVEDLNYEEIYGTQEVFVSGCCGWYMYPDPDNEGDSGRCLDCQENTTAERIEG